MGIHCTYTHDTGSLCIYVRTYVQKYICTSVLCFLECTCTYVYTICLNSTYMYLSDMLSGSGPLPHTTSDFWQMVMENKMSVIVMLTKVEEKGKVRNTRMLVSLIGKDQRKLCTHQH